MIRLRDAIILARTKLKVRTIRTGIAVAVSGLLFGVVGALIIITQGIFVSVDKFSEEGLNDRFLVQVVHWEKAEGFDPYDNLENPEFIQEVEKTRQEVVGQKKKAAKKYNIDYNPDSEDPNPIITDAKTKKKKLDENMITSRFVREVVRQRSGQLGDDFDIEKIIKQYSSARLVQSLSVVLPSDGAFVYMKKGSEAIGGVARVTKGEVDPLATFGDPTLQILEGSIARPFLTTATFDPSKGEIPVIVPFRQAESLLGLKKLPGTASGQEKLDRLREVRSRVGEVSISYCYRNQASADLLAKAIAQQKEIDRNAKDVDYVLPSVRYKLPDSTSCGGVEVVSDKRTKNERAYDESLVAYQKEVGEYIGDPIQKKITLRGVGVASEVDYESQASSVAEMINSLLNSWLGHGMWSIPGDLLELLPEDSRPDFVFNSEPDSSYPRIEPSHIIEFKDQNQAREMLKKYAYEDEGSVGISAAPFGSGILLVDEIKRVMDVALKYVFLAIGAVAIIILSGIVSRAVSDGRRESSIFRAIGASRLDIVMIYGVYVVLLAFRIIVFAAILAMAIGLGADVLLSRSATVGAHLAYAASDLSKEFHLFSLSSPYLVWTVGVIFIASILASIVPISLGARRNPIKDMRNDA